MPDQAQFFLFGLGSLIGIANIAFIIWHKKKNGIPKKWHKIGELSDIMCFPIKSCAPIREEEMDCTILGLEKGYLRDRTFMVITSDTKKVVAGTTHPHMTQIKSTINGSMLTLKAPEMIDINIDISLIEDNVAINAEICGETTPCVDCGNEVAHWLSRYIIKKDFGLQLVYYPFTTSLRDARRNYSTAVFPKISQIDSGSFSVVSSYMILNQSSVDDLNTRLEKPVTPQQFRPNFVIKGAEQYSEDNWSWIKIGDEAVFQCVKSCTRCSSATIDPETGIKAKDMQPLTTMKKYRQVTDPKQHAVTGDAPMMGIHLGLRQQGTVRLGDPVYINV